MDSLCAISPSWSACVAHYKGPNHRQNKLTLAHMHTCTRACAHTHSQQDSLKRWYFQDDLKDASVFDDLTLCKGDYSRYHCHHLHNPSASF